MTIKKFFIFTFFAVVLSSFRADNEYFVGRILYTNSFTDLKGDDITDRIAPYLGLAANYYIDGKNYKALNENNNWVQLYNSAGNSYYFFSKEMTAQKIDGATLSSKKMVVTRLDYKEMVAGYECSVIQIETDNETTIYFYNDSIKIDPKAFSKHNFGGWNTYLAATNGALPLMHIVTNYRDEYIWTSVASEVVKMNLTASDFEFPAGYTLRN